jgi:hypothetical protein
MPYSFQLHTHRFAAWCAATAAAASPKCRFPVSTGVRLIEATDLRRWGEDWGAVPEASDFDAAHRRLREDIVEQALAHAADITGTVSHGVAAKMINCYLKPIYACGVEPKDPDEHGKLAVLHPPIDRLLLDGLAEATGGAERSQWREWRDSGWSTFTSEQYENVMAAVRKRCAHALWEIEQYWKGHQ